GLRSRGLALAYHHHMGTVVQTLDELRALLSVTGDDVGLTLDTGHLAFAGANPGVIAQELVDRVRHVHLKDVRETVLRAVAQGPASYLDAIVDGVFTVPGDGDLDFRPVLEALAGAQYRGWLVVEADQDPSLAEPAEFARRGAEHVRRLAGAVGLAGVD
ncbi:MAG: TIM barrel protein, partial [Myxococcota bacterium]